MVYLPKERYTCRKITHAHKHEIKAGDGENFINGVNGRYMFNLGDD
jgi:hypothetical protein